MRGGSLPGGLGRWAGCNFCHCSTPKKLFFGGRDSPSNTPLRPAVTVKLHSGPKNKLKSVFPLLYFLLENGLGGESWQKCLLRDGFTERWWRKKQWWLPPIFLSPFFLPKRVLCVCAFFSRVCYAFHKCGGDAFLPPRKGRSFIQTISNLDIVLLPQEDPLFPPGGRKARDFHDFEKEGNKVPPPPPPDPPFSLATSQFTYGERK